MPGEVSIDTSTIFGKLWRSLGNTSPEGSSFYVEGSLKTEKVGRYGQDRKQITKVIGSKLIMLSERKKKKGCETGDEEVTVLDRGRTRSSVT